jgi:hypothetical protein
MVTINVTLGLGCTIFSYGFFVLCRYFARPLTVIRLNNKNPKLITKPYIRTWFTYSNVEEWERLNLLISWFHSLIIGLLVIYSFWAYSPEIYQDFVQHLSFITYFTCAFSFGMLK